MSEFSPNPGTRNNFQIYQGNNLVDDLDESLQVLPNEITETNTEAGVSAAFESTATNNTNDIVTSDGLATVNDAPELVEKIVMDLMKAGVTPGSTGWNEAIADFNESFGTETGNTLQGNVGQIFANTFSSLSGVSSTQAESTGSISQEIDANYDIAGFTDAPDIIEKTVTQLIKQGLTPGSPGWTEGVMQAAGARSGETSVTIGEMAAYESAFFDIISDSLGGTNESSTSLQSVDFQDTTSLGSLVTSLQGSTNETGFNHHGQWEYPIVTTITGQDYIRISRYRDNMNKDHRLIKAVDLIAALELGEGGGAWGEITGTITDQLDLISYINGVIPDISGKEDVGVAQGIMDTHESTYDHSLIATALQEEADTLQSVTDRGATTTNTITVSPSGNNDAIIANGSGSGSAITITHSGSGAQINGDGFDVDRDGDVTAKSFITSGGASTDFVKGDGSLDNIAYLSEADFADIKRQGVVDRAETTVSFDGTNTVTVTPTGTEWSYFRDGYKYTITGAKSVVIPGSPIAQGTWFIYIDATDGTLTASQTVWTLQDTKVPIFTVNWDNTATPKYWTSDERHSALIDGYMQYYLHNVDGARSLNTPTLADYTINTDTNAAKTFSITAGTLVDQDIVHSLASLPDPDGTATDYVVWYRTGASSWTWKLSNMPFLYNTSTDWIQYDNGGTPTDLTGGGGANARYTNSYLLLTNKSDASRFVITPGRGVFTSLADAQAESIGTFTWDGFPIAESVIVYQLTWSTVTSTSQGKCILAAAPKLVNISTVTNNSSGAGTDHNTLSNLQGGTLGEYYHLTSAEKTNVANLTTTYVPYTGATTDVDLGANNLSSTRLFTGLGTALLPAYSFTGDTNTGLWSPTADTLALSTGGTERMRITSTGNVGIGTTAPAAKLQIDTGVATTKGLIVKGFTSQTANLQEWQNSTGSILGYVDGTDGSMAIGGSALTKTGGGGTLQINSTNSWATLRLKSTTADWGFFTTSTGDFIFRNNTLLGMYDPFVIFKDAPNHSIGILGTSGNVGIGVTADNQANKLTVSGNTSIGSGYTTTAAPTNGLIVEGNVGIGTTAPAHKLEVVGSNTLNPMFNVVNNGSTAYVPLFEVNAPNLTAGQNGYLALGRNRATNNQFSLGFTYAGNGSTNNRLDINAYGTSPLMTVLASGNVGIGTAAPSAKLHTLGTTEQFRIGYDASNYYSTTVSSAGAVTLNAVGASAGFTFSDDVSVPDEAYGAGWDGSLEVPTKNALYDKIESMGGGGGATQVFNEVPTGLINSSNTVYTTASAYSASSTRVYLNGLRQILATDYTESGASQITFTTAPTTGDTLIIDYQL